MTQLATGTCWCTKTRRHTSYTPWVRKLDKVVDDTIAEKVPPTRPCPHSKQWWNQDLKKARRETRKYGWIAAKYMHAPDHPSHMEFQKKRNEYVQLLIDTKQKHWMNEWGELAAHEGIGPQVTSDELFASEYLCGVTGVLHHRLPFTEFLLVRWVRVVTDKLPQVLAE